LFGLLEKKKPAVKNKISSKFVQQLSAIPLSNFYILFRLCYSLFLSIPGD